MGVEAVLIQLATKGDGWALVAALLFIGWKIWKDVKPFLKKHYEQREREVKAREKEVEVGREIKTSIEGLTSAVQEQSQSVTKLAETLGDKMDKGFARITEKVETPHKQTGTGG